MPDTPQHWFDLRGRRLTRRDFVRLGRDVAACIAIGALPIGADEDLPLSDNPFLHGVASGDPEPDGVVLWTRLTLPLAGARRHAVRWEVADDEKFARIAVDRFRFAFVSCQNYEHGYFTAFDHLASEDVELVVHLGDYVNPPICVICVICG